MAVSVGEAAVFFGGRGLCIKRLRTHWEGCHGWEYAADYYRIEEFLDGAHNFRWRNLDVSEHDPMDTHEKLPGSEAGALPDELLRRGLGKDLGRIALEQPE